MIKRFIKEFDEEVIKNKLIEKGYKIKTLNRVIIEYNLKESLNYYNSLNNYVKNYRLAWKSKDELIEIIETLIMLNNYYKTYKNYLLDQNKKLGAYEIINRSILYKYEIFQVFTKELNKLINNIL